MAGSTDLMVYLNYIATWENESDANIDSLIHELTLFRNLGNFESDSVVDTEFDKLIESVKIIKSNAIIADMDAAAADVAALASVISFGMGMIVFTGLTAQSLYFLNKVNTETKELISKLNAVDDNISKGVGPELSNYISTFKMNNEKIAMKAPIGMDKTLCRSILLQFMAKIQNTETLNAGNFRKWAASCRLAFESDEINAVYDDLDKLNLSNQGEKELKEFKQSLDQKMSKSATLSNGLRFVDALSITYGGQTMRKALEGQEETMSFRMATLYGKIAFIVAAVVSVVDIILEIIDIVNIEEKYSKLTTSLNGEIRQTYKDFFNGIKDSSRLYNETIPLNNGGFLPSNIPLPKDDNV